MQKNKIGILTLGKNYFACNNLSKAIKAKIYYDENKINCDHLFIVGATCLKRYSKIKKTFKTVAVILSDSKTCSEYKWVNEYIKEKKLIVYAMPDLYEALTIDYVPVYQIIKLPEIDIKKSMKLLVSHSPGYKYSDNLKGSKEIFDIIKQLKIKYDFDYKCLTGLDYNTCIIEKSKSHIFIDQLIYNNYKIKTNRWGDIKYNGGLGKSGLEAMNLKCCVITGGKIQTTEPYFPVPPVMFTDYYDFYNTLEMVIQNESLRDSIIKNQYEWAKKYTSPEFVAMNITRHIQ